MGVVILSIDPKEVSNTICEYIENENANYAILLTGPWGAGKTFYWKNKLQKEIEKKGFSTLYVSLNGLDKTEQIARKIVTSRWKKQTAELVNVESVEKHKNLLGGVFASLGKMAKSLSPVGEIGQSLVKIDLRPENMIDYIDFQKTVICFDDLERCIDIEKTLGFINDFVEHKKSKTIILANENKIKETFAEVKEKIVGKTISFEMKKEEVLSKIIEPYLKELQEFYLSEIGLIIEMMECSKSCNYRVIKTILDDFSNVYNRSHNQLGFDRAKKQLLKYSLVVGLEIRVNCISEEEKQSVRSLSNASYIAWELCKRINNEGDKENTTPYYVELRKRYYSSDFEERYFFPSVFNYIDSGILDKDKFDKEILRYEEKEPSALQYLTNIGYWNLSDADFDSKIKGELLTSVENGEILIGLYPTVFLYFCHFQQKSLIEISLEDLEEKFINGLEKIEKNGESDCYMEDMSGEEILGEVRPAYDRICEFANRVRMVLKSNNQANKSSQFIEVMKKNIDDAIELTKQMEYFDVPLFASTSVEEVYNILKQLPNKKIVAFKNVLIQRYEQRTVRHKDYLNKDYKFIEELANYIVKDLPEKKSLLSQHLLKSLSEDVLQKCCTLQKTTF